VPSRLHQPSRKGTTTIRIGTLVPHFGSHASREAIVDLARKAEVAGFRSFWVRDHLIWEPHETEGPDVTFVEPFVTLAAISAVTTKSVVGTSVAIPIRWPLKLAQEFAGLSFLNPVGVTAGIGLGRNPREFRAAGLEADRKEEIFRETVAILRSAWSGERFDFRGEIFQLEGVRMLPAPHPQPMIVYGGNTPAAVRRAVDFADGWNCGSIPMATIRKRLDYLGDLAGAKRSRMTTIAQPFVVLARSKDEARRIVPVEALSRESEGSRLFDRPSSGRFETAEDLHGQLIFGGPADVAEGIAEFAALGVDELILDFRLQFDRYSEVIEIMESAVFPQLTTLLPLHD
jgi:alkanesulfonate monooxygenase SsuD/methylene tetrahydromethanopterin reductase-like flavin-dependent oxidoreductase (luciferase family)